MKRACGGAAVAHVVAIGASGSKAGLHFPGCLWKSILYNSLLPSRQIKGPLLKQKLGKRWRDRVMGRLVGGPLLQSSKYHLRTRTAASKSQTSTSKSLLTLDTDGESRCGQMQRRRQAGSDLCSGVLSPCLVGPFSSTLSVWLCRILKKLMWKAAGGCQGCFPAAGSCLSSTSLPEEERSFLLEGSPGSPRLNGH